MNIQHIIAALEGSGGAGVQTLFSNGLTGGSCGELLDNSKDKIFIDLMATCRNFAPTANPLYTVSQGIVPISTTGPNKGWPTTSFVAVLLTNAIASDFGEYQCAFQGQATVTCVGTGTASTIYSYSYGAGNNTTSFGLSCAGDIILQFTGLSADFALFRCFRPGYPIVGNTFTFTNEYQFHANRCQVFKFTDWLEIDNSTDTNWSTKDSDVYGALRAARSFGQVLPFLAATQKPGWFQLPHAANGGYQTSWLTAINDNLPSIYTAYMEYSNTTWDTTKTQYSATYSSAQSQVNFFTKTSAAGGQYIVGVQRTSNVVTVQVNGNNHGRSVGQTIGIFGIGGITSGYYPIASVLSTKIFTFAQTGADVVGTISTSDDSSLIIANGDHILAQALSYSTGGLTAEMMRLRVVMSAIRTLYTAAQSYSTKTRMKFIYTHPPGKEDLLTEVLAWAVVNYGTLSTWLYGVGTDGFLSLSDPISCTAKNIVFSQLTASLPGLQSQISRFVNTCVAQGVKPILSRWGIDTHTTPIPAVATAVQQAHEDPAMAAYFSTIMTSWKNYGGDKAVIYRLGAAYTYGVDGTQTWSLVEGDVSVGTQYKYLGYRASTGIAVTPVSESGVTAGTISIPDLFPLTIFASTSSGNGILPSTLANVPELVIQVCADTARTYTLGVYAAQNSATTSTMTVKIDGTTLVTGTALTGASFNVTTTPAPLAYTTTIALTAGLHLVKLSFPVHNSNIAVRQITFT